MKNGLMNKEWFLLTLNWENQSNSLTLMINKEGIHSIEVIKIRYLTLIGSQNLNSFFFINT
jgi:hypothetical protein